MGCSLVQSGSFRALRHKAESWSCAQTLPWYKNASALVVTQSANGNQFMLPAFSNSLVLRTKVPFNKSEVIALEVQITDQFGLIDVNLHLRSDQDCRVSFTSFGLHYEWQRYTV